LITTGDLLFYPKGFNIRTYLIILTQRDFLHAAFISVARTIIGPMLMIAITAMAGYVTANRKLHWRKTIIRFFIITMYVSAGIMPTYLLIKYLGLMGTFNVYIIPTLFSAFNLILVKTYVEALPGDLRESAVIDGANDIMIFYRIILPLITPVCAAILLFSAVGHWNSYIDTVLYNSQRRDLYTLQYVLMIYLNRFGYNPNFRQIEEAAKGMTFSPFTIQTTMTVITVLPILCVYPFLQKYFAKGLLVGAIKA
jgi:putative aldouronate transport system permease protein